MTTEEFKIQYALGTLHEDTLCKLAKSNNKAILIILSKDKDPWVRYWTAKNSNTPEEIKKILSEDINYFVRLGIYKNPSTSLEIVQQMKNHESRYD